MSLSNKHKDDASVDWAERLRASMNQDADERTDRVSDFHDESSDGSAVAPAISDEEDDLAALLRAQLAKQASHEVEIDLPDVSEFEAVSDLEDMEGPEDPEDVEEFEDPEDPEDVEEFEDPEDPEYVEEFEDPEDPEDVEEFEDPEDPEDVEEFEDPEEPEDIDEFEDPEDPEYVEELEDPEEPEDVEEFEDPEEPEDVEEFEDSEESEDVEEFEDPEDVEDFEETEDPLPEPEINDQPDLVAISVAAVPSNAPFHTDVFLNGRADSGRLHELEARNACLLDALFDETAVPDLHAEGDDSLASDETTNAVRTTDRREGRSNRRPNPIGNDPMQTGPDGSPSCQPAPYTETATPPRKRPHPMGGEHTTAGTQTGPVSGRLFPSKEADAPVDYTHTMAEDDRESANERDTDLYLHLGYEDRLRHADEQARVERVRNGTAAFLAADAKTADPNCVADGAEYRGRSDTEAVKRRYLGAFRAQVARMAIALVGAWIALIYDILPAVLPHFGLSVEFAEQSKYPVMGILWTILVCLPFLSRLGHGLKGLFCFAPERYSVSALGVAVSLVYAALAAVSLAWGWGNLPLYTAVPLWMLLIASLTEYVALEGEYRAFSVVSSGKDAHILTDEMTPAASRLSERSASGALEARLQGRATDTPIFTVTKTDLLGRYFARTEKYNPYMGRLNYLLPAALLGALILAGVGLARGGALLTDGVRIFTASYLGMMPAAYLVSMSLPLWRANRCMTPKGAAVIGTAAPCDYDPPKGTRIVFREGDAITAVHRKEITLRDDPDAARWHRIANRLFRVLGSPLASEIPFEDDRTARNGDRMHAEIIERDTQYIKLQFIDASGASREAVEVMMGSHEALVRRGVRLPKPTMERAYKKSEDSHVVYLAFDGYFRIAYAAEYRADQTFLRTAEELLANGLCPVIATYDPLLTPDLLAKPRLSALADCRFVRPDYVETARHARESGLLATGAPTDLRYPMAACRRMSQAYRQGSTALWIATGIGFCLSFASVLFDRGSLLTSGAVIAAHTVAAVLLGVLSSATVSAETLFPEEAGPAATAPSDRPENKK